MSNVATPEPENATNPKRFLKVRDVATLLDVPASTVYDLSRAGRVPGLTRFGRHVRFERSKLEAWLDSGGGEEAA